MIEKIVEKIQGVFRSKEDLDLTGGPVAENLLYLAIPIVMINLLQTAYNLGDTFWLGQYSKDALAAISFAFPLVFFLISLGMGLSVAGNVLVSQFEGSGRSEKRDYAASQTITFSLAASIILGAVGYFLMPSLVHLFGAASGVAAGATSYLQVISVGLFFMFGFAVFMSLMRGFGDVVTPMLIMLVTVILNIILDPFLINGWAFFPEMGVTGAAIATIFSRLIALMMGMYVLFTGRRGIQINLNDMVPDLSFLGKMMNIALPATIGGIGRSVSINLLVAVVGNLFGTAVVSGYGIGVRMFSLIFLPAIAGGWAVSTMTGQNLGAGKPDRAEMAADLAAKYMFLILSGIGVITFIFASSIASVFSPDPAVISVATQFLRWVSLTFGFMGVLRAYTGSFRGAGNTMTAAAISIATLAVIRLPVAYFGSIYFVADGPLAIWIAFAASNIIGGLLAWGYYQRGTWRESVVDNRKKGQVAEEADDIESTISDQSGKSGLLDHIPGLNLVKESLPLL
ncbi:MAG: MATE family efflux transporter [Candidatus Nanohaloarchaea archaeon]